MIIQRKTGSFDPATFRDLYQEALRELIEAKIKGLPVKARPEARPDGSVSISEKATKRPKRRRSRRMCRVDCCRCLFDRIKPPILNRRAEFPGPRARGRLSRS
jgi:hypothetical protein